MFFIDKIFKINQLKLILLIIIKIIFINKNFLAIYNFIKSESVILFNFLFDNFKYFVFGNNIIKFKVILTDQIAGLIIIIPILIPNCLFQHYN